MSIKKQGGVFGRNPTFNEVNVDDSLLVNTSEITADVSVGDTVLQISGTDAVVGPELVLHNKAGSDLALSSITFGGFRLGNPGAAGRISSNRRGIISFGNNDAGNHQDTVTDRLTIEEDGDITVETGNVVIGTSGKGIDFSATSGTGTSELFDDYEEGTYTADLYEEDGSTLDTVTGNYTKVGNIVTINFQSLGGTTGGSGQVRSNLPFVADEAFSNTIAYSVSNGGMVAGFTLGSGHLKFVDTIGAIAGGNKMRGSDIGSSSRLYFSLTYRTSD